MTSRLALLAAASALLSNSAAMAQPAASAATVNTIHLEKMCHADGALNLRFGDQANGLRKGAYAEAVVGKLDSELLPFTEVNLGYSRYSNRLWNFGYVAIFETADEANTAADLLAAKAKALNWNLVTSPEDENHYFQYNFSSKPEPGDPPASDETSFNIIVDDTVVSINCENTVQSMAQFDEALGKMPIGTPRPQLADYSVLQSSFIVADCSDATKREAFQREMDDRGRSAFSPNWSRATYEEDLANWKIMKLTSSGKTDFDAVSDKIIALIDSPDSVESLEGGLALLEEFGTDMEKLDPQDEAGMCRIMHKMMTNASTLSAPKPGAKGDAVTPQWQATHAMLDKEAKRLGVSFDS